MSSAPSQSTCRLCGGALSPWATLRVLRKYDVSYFTCSGCGSLQTEMPYWLDEAYRERGTGADTGACQRSFDLAVRTTGLLSLMEWPHAALCLDFGAGVGLYGRMMRDRGYDFLAYDRYHFPFYMDHFRTDDPGSVNPRLVTAHEVLEHLPNPTADLAAIFGRGADLVIATTDTFENQGPDWWYLILDEGQHVFFYTPAALRLIGTRFGYNYQSVAGLHVFWRPGVGGVEAGLAIAGDTARFLRHCDKMLMRHQSNAYQAAQRDTQLIKQRN